MDLHDQSPPRDDVAGDQQEQAKMRLLALLALLAEGFASGKPMPWTAGDVADLMAIATGSA